MPVTRPLRPATTSSRNTHLDRCRASTKQPLTSANQIAPSTSLVFRRLKALEIRAASKRWEGLSRGRLDFHAGLSERRCRHRRIEFRQPKIGPARVPPELRRGWRRTPAAASPNRRATPTPWGSRPSTAALTRLGARKANETVSPARDQRLWEDPTQSATFTARAWSPAGSGAAATRDSSGSRAIRS